MACGRFKSLQETLTLYSLQDPHCRFHVCPGETFLSFCKATRGLRLGTADAAAEDVGGREGGREGRRKAVAYF